MIFSFYGYIRSDHRAQVSIFCSRLHLSVTVASRAPVTLQRFCLLIVLFCFHQAPNITLRFFILHFPLTGILCCGWWFIFKCVMMFLVQAVLGTLFIRCSFSNLLQRYCKLSWLFFFPKQVIKKLSAKKIAKRSRLKPFIKVVNYNHIMPTR